MDPKVSACFTPIQVKMYSVLADGRLHRPQELHDCLYERDAPMKNISAHLSGMRRVLRTKGEDIIYTGYDGGYYQLRRLIQDK